MDREESNKWGVKKAIPKFGCMAENSVDIDTFFFLLFVICYLFLEAFQVDLLLFLTQRSMALRTS